LFPKNLASCLDCLTLVEKPCHTMHSVDSGVETFWTADPAIHPDRLCVILGDTKCITTAGGNLKGAPT